MKRKRRFTAGNQHGSDHEGDGGWPWAENKWARQWKDTVSNRKPEAKE